MRGKVNNMKDTTTTDELIELCKIYGIDEAHMMRLLKLKADNLTEQTTARDFYLGIGG